MEYLSVYEINFGSDEFLAGGKERWHASANMDWH
jgi:hypothetical protein